MKIGTSFNFAASSREGVLDIFESLTLIKNAGFDAVEIDLSRGIGAEALASSDWRKRLEAIRAAAESLGIVIVSAHAPHDPRLYIPEVKPTAEERERFDALLGSSAEAAHILGAGILVVHPVDDLINAEYDSQVNLETNKKYLAGVLCEAEKYGVRIAVENVYYSSEYRLRRRYGESAEEVIALADAIGAGVCWNFGHAHPVTMDQARAVTKIGERLVLMHLSDSRGHTDAGLPPMIGGGNIKWEQIMPAVAKLGYKGYAILQADQYLNNMPKSLQLDAAKFARTVCHRLEEMAK
jgi:sugar phosphate isomerase/epimerase